MRTPRSILCELQVAGYVAPLQWDFPFSSSIYVLIAAVLLHPKHWWFVHQSARTPLVRLSRVYNNIYLHDDAAGIINFAFCKTPASCLPVCGERLYDIFTCYKHTRIYIYIYIMCLYRRTERRRIYLVCDCFRALRPCSVYSDFALFGIYRDGRAEVRQKWKTNLL